MSPIAERLAWHQRRLEGMSIIEIVSSNWPRLKYQRLVELTARARVAELLVGAKMPAEGISQHGARINSAYLIVIERASIENGIAAIRPR